MCLKTCTYCPCRVATAWAGDSRAVLGRHTGAADPFSQTVDSADGAVLTTTPGHSSREGSREVSRIPPRTRSAESVSTHLESAVQEVSRMAGCPHALAAAAWCGGAACIEGGVLVRQLLPATSTKFRSATLVVPFSTSCLATQKASESGAGSSAKTVSRIWELSRRSWRLTQVVLTRGVNQERQLQGCMRQV